MGINDIRFGVLVAALSLALSSSAFAGGPNNLTDPYAASIGALQGAGVKVKGSGGDVVVPTGIIDGGNGFAMATFRETFHGLEVRGGGYKVVTQNGQPFAVTGYTKQISVSPTPRVKKDEAIVIAGAATSLPINAVPVAQLVVVRGPNGYERLVWEVAVPTADLDLNHEERVHEIVNVDARTGEVLAHFRGIRRTLDTPGSEGVTTVQIYDSPACAGGAPRASLWGELRGHRDGHLEVYPLGESYAIAEAYSDFGTIDGGFEKMEYCQANPGGTFYDCSQPASPNYLIGEDQFPNSSPVRAVRYAFAPALDGVSPACYSSNVGSMSPDRAAGIGNRFLYTLAQGTAPKVFSGVTHYAPTCNGSSFVGIGRLKTRAILNWTKEWYLSPTASYSDMRVGTVFAATQLYGATSAEVAAVKAAWDAVNVR